MASGVQLLLHDATAFLALLHVIEFAARLLDAAVEERYTGQFVDQAAAFAVAHRHDAGHIPLHHHVAAFRVDAKAPQLGLQLLEVAGLTVSGVAAAVGAARHHPQFAGHGPFLLVGLDPGAFFRGFESVFCSVGLPVAEVKPHAHHGFGGFARFEDAAVHQVGQTIGPHATAGGQAKAKKHSIKDVALAGPIGSCHHGETCFQGDAHRPPEGLEVLKPDLIDMNQQDQGGCQRPEVSGPSAKLKGEAPPVG